MQVTTNTPAVEAEHVTFRFNGNVVLEDVTFSLRRGSFTALVGPNGGGKTTLLSLLIGLKFPASGTVKLLGVSPERARSEGRIGYVPQRIAQTALEFPATVEEVVRDGTTPASHRLCDCNVHSGAAAAAAAMEAVGITHLRKRTLAMLSGGERQKVFIARAVAASPDILLLDEPTTGVDTPSQADFYAMLKRLNKERGVTIVLVSHDIDAVSRSVDSVLCLNRTIASHCCASNVQSQPVIDALYGQHATALCHRHE